MVVLELPPAGELMVTFPGRYGHFGLALALMYELIRLARAVIGPECRAPRRPEQRAWAKKASDRPRWPGIAPLVT